MSFGRDPGPLPAARGGMVLYGGDGTACTLSTVHQVLWPASGALGQRRGPGPNSRTSALLAGIPGRGRKSRSDRLPEFSLGGPPDPPGPAEEPPHGHADSRVLPDPLAPSPARAGTAPGHAGPPRPLGRPRPPVPG